MQTSKPTLNRKRIKFQPPTINFLFGSWEKYLTNFKILIALTGFLLSSIGLNAQTNLEAVTFGSGKFVAIASNGELLSSLDGVTWTSLPAPSGNWQDIIYSNSTYVVVGTNSAMTSPDGENWTIRTVPDGSWVSVVSNGTLFVASATWGSNYVMTSPDGETWTVRTPAFAWSHDDLAYGSISGVDRFVAVCQFGRGWIASNPTGTWSQINPGAIVDIRAVTFGDGKFVWLQWGGSGTVYAGVSNNGTSFTPYASGVVNQWNSLVYGNGLYIAVASGGANTRAAYSTNGQSWSYGTGVEANSWQSVAFGNNTFVAVANTGENRIMYSTDGIAWNHDVVLPAVIEAPVLSSIFPTNTILGASMVLTGINFENITEVEIGGVNVVSFTIDSPTQITAIVPSGAQTGNVSVANSAGSARMSGFVINSAPTNIILSNHSISENNAINELIGVFSTADVDIMDTHNYSLVSGTGDTHNADFSLVGNSLITNIIFDYETQNSYTIRVAVQDNLGNTFEKILQVDVVNNPDEDNDGILDIEDQCTNTPSGETADTNGCSDSQKDADGDGVNDALDQCPNTLSGEVVDANGCSDSQKDSDNDGINDALDQCSNTSSGETVDINGCSDSEKDTDGDGVNDALDQCAATPLNEMVDANGCSTSQKDTDGDGVSDILDQCPNTPSGDTVDINGCSDSQKDSDNDGVNDALDQCPNTPIEASVDINGCPIATLEPDADSDGVSDALDQCPDTLVGATVDANGCSVNQIDTDGDGIPDGDDNCPETYNPGQEDRDGDGLGDVCDTVELNVSQAFTPNGDGINDTWVIYNIQNYPNSLVRVFNSWGKEVFSVRNYQNDWDGRYKNLSDKLPDAGSYYYQIDFDGDGNVDQDGWLYITSR